MSKPLNIEPYLHVKNICYIIGDTQAKKIGFDKPHAKKHAIAGGPTCGVSDRGDGENNLDIGFQKHFSLDDAYARKNDWPYFKADSVQGYPIVFGTADDDRKTGTCVVHVGVTNQITSDIMYTDNATESGDNACKMAKKTASEVVTTLKKTK